MTHADKCSYRSLLTLIVAGLLLIGGYTVMASRSHVIVIEQPPPTRVGTVDFERLFSELAIVRVAEDNLERFITEMAAEEERLQKEVTTVRDGLDMFEPGGEQHDREMRRLYDLAIRLDARGEFNLQKANIHTARILMELYDQIRAATARFAEQNGFDMILINDAELAVEPGPRSVVEQQIMARRMLYRSSLVNVTDELITFINAENR